jgi:hypothetical protein
MAKQILAQSIQAQSGSVLSRIRGEPMGGDLRLQARCDRLRFAGQGGLGFDGGQRGEVYRFW